MSSGAKGFWTAANGSVVSRRDGAGGPCRSRLTLVASVGCANAPFRASYDGAGNCTDDHETLGGVRLAGRDRDRRPAILPCSNEELGNGEKQVTGRWANNRLENNHLLLPMTRACNAPVQANEQLTKFTLVHANVHNYSNLKHHLVDRIT